VLILAMPLSCERFVRRYAQDDGFVGVFTKTSPASNANRNEMFLLGFKIRRSKAVVSHISRKTSEMWGTLGSVAT
jgi:hypothetical protein